MDLLRRTSWTSTGCGAVWGRELRRKHEAAPPTTHTACSPGGSWCTMGLLLTCSDTASDRVAQNPPSRAVAFGGGDRPHINSPAAYVLPPRFSEVEVGICLGHSDSKSKASWLCDFERNYLIFLGPYFIVCKIVSMKLALGRHGNKSNANAEDTWPLQA